jgi:hypothetical protein
MKIKYSWIFVLATTLNTAPVWGYTCDANPGISPSTPLERFKDNGNGTLTDIKTGMTWMRCALGQHWHDLRRCSRQL